MNEFLNDECGTILCKHRCDSYNTILMLYSRIRTLTLSSLFHAFFLLELAPAFFAFEPVFPALALTFFFFVPEFALFISDVFPAISSVILFALPPAFLRLRFRSSSDP